MNQPLHRLPVVQKSKYDPRAHGADCDNCPCKGLPVVPPVIPEGEPLAILVGQEPGFTEVRQLTPFIGPSGKRVDRILAKYNLPRERMHITNAALCLPRKDEDRPIAMKCCAPRLQNEINAHPKHVPVVPMGGPAFKNVMGKKIPITLARGFLWNKDGRDVLPTLHPAFVLREGVQWPLFSRDFRRLSNRIKNGFLEVEKPPSVIVPRTAKDLRAALDKLGPIIACDIETSKDQPTQAILECIGISDGKTTIVVPWLPFFKFLLTRCFKKRRTIFHNGFAFDSIVLAKHGVHLGEIEDTLIAHHAYASHFPQRLDHLVSFYLDAEPWKIKFGKRTSDEKGQHKDLTEEQLFAYNALDVYLTFRLWEEMTADLGPWHSLYNHDKDIAALCRDMQESGVYVDLARKNELSAAIKAKEERLYKEMVAECGREFAPTKPNDIRHILYEEFKAPIIERTNTGLPSTNKKVLAAFSAVADRPYGEFCKKLVEWRACTKMRTTYLDNLIVEVDGRVHPSWRSFGTPTGRYACRKPNLQNLKRSDRRFKDEPEQKIRSIYIATEGRIFVTFDMSQVEQRVAAYLSQDPNFINSVESGDMHTANARLIFGNLPELMDPKEAKEGKGKPLRDAAKSSGFAVNYLAGAETVYQKLRADGFPAKLSDVIAMLEKLKKAFKRYYAFVEENIELCKKKGYVKAGFLSGRLRWIGHNPEISMVANTPIQGGAADAMNDRLVKIWKRMKIELPGAKLVAQIHDSGIFEVVLAQADHMERIIREVMDVPYIIHGRTVKLPIDLKRGMRWSEL